MTPSQKIVGLKIAKKLVEQYQKELLIERLKVKYREKQFEIAAQEKAKACTR
jgi:hypothetical protein